MPEVRRTEVRRTRPLRAAACLLPLFFSACALPQWPVQGPVTSAFGFRWRGVLPDVHRGVDIGVPLGTPVRAMAGGRVRFAGVQTGYGNVVWIDHGGEVLSVYAHLSELRASTGDPVAPGQVVGLSGNSGNAVGPHLHFEIWRWGSQTDPAPLLAGSPGRD